VPSPPPFVTIKGASFAYPNLTGAAGRQILSGLDLEVQRGQLVALMGGSGSGKTTVLRMLGGQVRPQAGNVTFDGQDVHAQDPKGLYALRRRMGMLFQFGALFTDMSVFDNVAFPLREHTALPESAIRDLVLMKLHAVGLRRSPAACRAGWHWRAPSRSIRN
jgi:phospholipid/cholesterol/gamma-HCH transport system ATP-binding protein